jgi:transposase-like protein
MPKPSTSFYDVVRQHPDEASAERYFIQKRWPNGITCPRCGYADTVRGVQAKRNRQLWYCHAVTCQAMFSVTSGTVMEFTKLPLQKWMHAYQIMSSSKQGVSALQLARMIGVAYRTAWHLSHRIRATMTSNPAPFTGIVETDETYIGGKHKGHGHGFRGNKIAVQTIIRRNTSKRNRDGQAQTMALNNGQKVDGRAVGAKLRIHTDPAETILMTDESPIYTRVGKSFAEHHTVNHKQEEYVRVEPDGLVATTNSAEGYFANLKRKIVGTHHSTSKKHLPRYLEENDFNYNNRGVSDVERAEAAIGQMEGRSVRLYKPRHGGGDSLYDHKEGEEVEGPPLFRGPQVHDESEGEPDPRWAQRAGVQLSGNVHNESEDTDED